MVIIWLSVKRAFFIEISSVQITRKFYLLIHRFFGGITHSLMSLWLIIIIALVSSHTMNMMSIDL
ncbi:hypothetical protein AL507_20315 [Providencia stuartii]|nr:hypothetical protein AL507_20315 [Providencia stuartii]